MEKQMNKKFFPQYVYYINIFSFTSERVLIHYFIPLSPSSWNPN